MLNIFTFFAQHLKHPRACQKGPLEALWLCLTTFRFFSCFFLNTWLVMSEQRRLAKDQDRQALDTMPTLRQFGEIRLSQSLYMSTASPYALTMPSIYESSRMHASRSHEKAPPFRQSLQTRTSMPQHATINILWLHFAATLPKHCKGGSIGRSVRLGLPMFMHCILACIHLCLHVIVVMIMGNIIAFTIFYNTRGECL